MHVLDADDAPLVGANGAKMQRDVVDFVAFRDFASRPIHDLAEAVLREVPSQAVKFMKMHGISPNAPSFSEAMSMATSAAPPK